MKKNERQSFWETITKDQIVAQTNPIPKNVAHDSAENQQNKITPSLQGPDRNIAAGT